MQKKIAVFAGSECAKQKTEFYHDMAYQTGFQLAAAGFAVVTGAGTGLMNETARGAKDGGGRTIGYGLELFDRVQSPFVDEFQIFQKLTPRQEKIIAESDGYVALPGGVGTLYEILNVVEGKKIGEIPSDKPIVLIGGYYDRLGAVFDRMLEEGFIQNNLNDIFIRAATPTHAVFELQRAFLNN